MGTLLPASWTALRDHFRTGTTVAYMRMWTVPASRLYTCRPVPIPLAMKRTCPAALTVAVPLVFALVVGTSGCSFVAMKRATDSMETDDYPDCTSSWTNPLVDMAGAVLSGSASVLLHSQASSEENRGDSGKSFRTAAWSATGLAAVFIASGAYGAYQRGRCQRLIGRAPEDRSWLQESVPMPGTLGGRCKQDQECQGGLVCDEPMRTCIETPAPTPTEPAPTPTAPAAPDTTSPP